MKPVTVIGPFSMVGKRLALGHVLPVARHGAADLLLGDRACRRRRAPGRCSGAAGGPSRPCTWCPARAPGRARCGSTSCRRSATQVAVLVEEIDVIGLLHGAAGEARLVLDEVLQPRLGRDRRRCGCTVLCQCPVGARPHGVDAGQAADIAGHDAAGGEQEARQRDHVAELRLGGVFRNAPQRIVVADAVGVVADVVARCLVAPRLGGHADLHADALAQRVQALAR